jgi:hypothetical protein
VLDERIVAQRLALIKYMAHQADAQMQAPVPMSSIALLLLHDAIELFLVLACDRLNIPSEKLLFDQYVTKVDERLRQDGKAELELRGWLGKLNKARVSLKHHGITPSAETLSEARLVANEFLLQNTKIIFGIEYESVSLLDIIQQELVRLYLTEAQLRVDREEFQESLAYCAVAFAELKKWFVRQISDFEYVISPFRGGVSDHSVPRWGLEFGDLDSFYRQMNKGLNEVSDALRVIGMGLDYRTYQLFERITPSVEKYGKQDYWHWHWASPITNLSLQHCNWAINYVLESSLSISTVTSAYPRVERQKGMHLQGDIQVFGVENEATSDASG